MAVEYRGKVWYTHFMMNERIVFYMKAIDLTQLISETMPVYPGTETPRLIPASSYEADHFKETVLHMYSHTGTHMDPPAHIIPGRTTLDAMPIDAFVGSALVIDCRDIPQNGTVTLERIKSYGSDADEAEFLLFNYGWDRYWGRTEYFEGYPCLGDDAVEYVISSGKKGVGFDAISADPVASLKIHGRLFEKNEIVIIENLTNLDKIPGGLFTLFALPLRWENADGSPIRAVAYVK